MPEIPLFRNDNRMGNTPAPVLDREARPRVDARGLIARVGQLADSAKGSDASQYMRQLGADSFGGANAKALQSVAAGVSDVTSTLLSIAERKADAQNDIDLAEAESTLDSVFDEFDQWRMQPGNINNAAAWGSKWDEMSQKAIGSVMERPYSQLVKDRLAAYTTQWQRKTSGRVAVDATKTIFRRAGEAIESRRMLRLAQGDVQGAEEINAEAVAKGHKVADTAALENFQGREVVFSQDRANAIAVDPVKAQEWAANPDAEDAPPAFRALANAPAERVKTSLAAQAELAQQKSMINTSISGAIKAGEVSDPTSLGLLFQRVDPMNRLSEDEKKFHMDSVLGVPVDIGLFQNIESKIKEWDPSADDAVKRGAEIDNAIALLGSRPGSDYYAQSLKEAFELKEKTFNDGLKTQFDSLESSIDNMKNEGAFGVYLFKPDSLEYDKDRDMWTRARESWEGPGDRIPVQISQEDKRKLTDGEFEDGDYITDTRAKLESERIASDLKMKFQRKRANGEYGNDPSLAQKELQLMTESATREMMRKKIKEEQETTSSQLEDWSGNARSVDPTQAPPPTMEGSLPSMEQGGRIDASLFDSIYNQTR